MANTSRFGQKLKLPSTAEIKHELRLMGAADALVTAGQERYEVNNLTAGQTTELVGDLAAKHGMSADRARMLVERYGIGRHTLDGVAHDLQAWRA